MSEQKLELKPCPFCGGTNLRFNLSDIEGWIAHVECTDCDDMLGPMSEYKYPDKEDAEQDAAAVWNKRPDLSAQVHEVAIPDGWQLVPKEPTDEMFQAFRLAHGRKCIDISGPYPTEHPDDGGGPIGYGYRAMLAASPALSTQMHGTLGLESNPETLRWWCQQLLDIIENYDISHDAPEEEIALLNDIRAAVDPALSPSTLS